MDSGRKSQAVRAVAEKFIRAFCFTAVFYQLIQYLGCIVQYYKEQLPENHKLFGL
jgi:hypothetical protein